MRRERGFVAIEFVLAAALLLLPVVMLVAATPRWVERRHAATVAAREAARVAAESFPADERAGEQAAVAVAANYGVAPSEIDVHVVAEAVRGGQVRATVTVRLPALAIPFGGGIGAWHLTTSHSVRIDDYRSLT
jgi:Flp pilus assembly protein TadG